MSLKCRISDLPEIEQRAKETLSELKSKYPGLDSYLVYSSRLGQSNLGSKPEVLLKEFPQMFHDSPEKAKALQLLQNLRKAEQNQGLEKNDTTLSRILSELELDLSVQIELRFGQLNYAQVAQLQLDSLVDRVLTPQTPASIRIVLGTLAAMRHRQSERVNGCAY